VSIRAKDGLSLLLLVSLIVVAGVLWPTLPDPMPVRWTAGEVTRFAPKAFGVFLLPGVAALAFAAVSGLARLEMFAHVAGPLATLRLVTVAFHGVLFASVMSAARGGPFTPTLAAGLSLGALFVFLGIRASGVEPNWAVGIRTPWTLRDDRVWVATHRVAGPVFVVLGLVVLGLYALQPQTSLLVVVALVLAAAAGLSALSWVFWRRLH
jgi:uncharacterized membrane protein